MYNNTKNVSIKYMFFKFNYRYYSYISYKKKSIPNLSSNW